MSCHVFTSFRKLSFLHTLTNIPVNKCTLGIHQVKFVVQSSPSLSNGGGAGKHANSSLDLGKISTRNHSWWLVVDTDLESSWTPVNKLDGPLGLDGGNGSIDILGDHISSVEHAAGHVLAMTRITLDHLVGWLKASIGDFRNTQLLMIGLLSRDDWCIGYQREVDSWIRNQVSLELSQIHIECSVKPERGSDGGHDLANHSIEVGVGGTINVKITTTDVIDGLVVNHEGTVRVLQGGVGGQDGVVGLHHSSGHLGSGVDGKLQLGFLAIVH